MYVSSLAFWPLQCLANELGSKRSKQLCLSVFVRPQAAVFMENVLVAQLFEHSAEGFAEYRDLTYFLYFAKQIS